MGYNCLLAFPHDHLYLQFVLMDFINSQPLTVLPNKLNKYRFKNK